MNFLNKSTGASEQANGHCQARTLSGGPCRALPLHGGSLCVFHSPEARAAVRAGNRRGGKTTARRLKASDLASLDLSDPEAALRMVVAAAAKGTINEGQGRVILAGLKQFVELTDLRAIDARVRELEESQRARR